MIIKVKNANILELQQKCHILKLVIQFVMCSLQKSFCPRCIQEDRIATLSVYYIIGSRKWLYIIALLEERGRLPGAAAAVPMWFQTMPALMKFLSDSIIASACLQACFLVLESCRVLGIAKQKGQRSTIFGFVSFHQKSNGWFDINDDDDDDEWY